jgi:hypothetical protein
MSSIAGAFTLEAVKGLSASKLNSVSATSRKLNRVTPCLRQPCAPVTGADLLDQTVDRIKMDRDSFVALKAAQLQFRSDRM